MSRYFFDTQDGGRTPNNEGIELPNAAAARVHAIKFAGTVMSSDPTVLWNGNEFRVEVRDQRRHRLFTVVCYAVDE